MGRRQIFSRFGGWGRSHLLLMGYPVGKATPHIFSDIGNPGLALGPSRCAEGPTSLLASYCSSCFDSSSSPFWKLDTIGPLPDVSPGFYGIFRDFQGFSGFFGIFQGTLGFFAFFRSCTSSPKGRREAFGC